MRLRAASQADVPAIARLEGELFAGESPWSAAVVAAEVAHPACRYLVADDAAQVVGYVGLARLGPPADPEFEVHTIGVAPSAQGRGVGRALLEAVLEHADAAGGPVFLEVRTDNAAAIGLYESMGFVRLGVRKNYYQPSGADAFTMRRGVKGQDEQ